MSSKRQIGLVFFVAPVHLPVVVFPKVSVSALTRHVKHCEGKTKRTEEKTENFYRVKKTKQSITYQISYKIL